MIIRTSLLALTIVVQFQGPAAADGNVANGESVSKKCVACHQFLKTENRTGPHLVGLIGRAVASVDGFKYSDAMTKHAATVPVWTEETLNSYLENPRAAVPGTRMAFGGLKKEQERTDLIAYLKSIAK